MHLAFLTLQRTPDRAESSLRELHTAGFTGHALPPRHGLAGQGRHRAAALVATGPRDVATGVGPHRTRHRLRGESPPDLRYRAATPLATRDGAFPSEILGFPSISDAAH